MKPIRVVQYGGWRLTHAEHTMLTMRSLPQYFDVAGFCEPDEKLLEQLVNKPAYKDLKIYTKEEILNDKSLDAVIVETSEITQAEDALFFAKAGFNVHSDKPCGASNETFEKLIACVKEKKLVFQNGYMYRYNPAIKRAYEIVSSGEIGEIICTEAQMSECYHGSFLKQVGSMPGGMMFYLGCHLLDLVYMFMGEPMEIHSFNSSSNLECSDIKDFGLVLLKYKHGYSYVKTVACEVSGSARRQFVISGTKGTIEIKPIENPVELPNTVCPNKIFMNVTKEGHPMAFADRPETISFPPYGRYNDMMIDFAKTVAGEKTNTFDYDSDLAVHRLLTNVCK